MSIFHFSVTPAYLTTLRGGEEYTWWRSPKIKNYRYLLLLRNIWKLLMVIVRRDARNRIKRFIYNAEKRKYEYIICRYEYLTSYPRLLFRSELTITRIFEFMGKNLIILFCFYQMKYPQLYITFFKMFHIHLTISCFCWFPPLSLPPSFDGLHSMNH